MKLIIYFLIIITGCSYSPTGYNVELCTVDISLKRYPQYFHTSSIWCRFDDQVFEWAAPVYDTGVVCKITREMSLPTTLYMHHYANKIPKSDKGREYEDTIVIGDIHTQIVFDINN